MITLIFPLQLIFFVAFCSVEAIWEFKNIECTSLDKNFTYFDYCYLKSVNRTYKYMSLRAKLLQLPVTSVKINLASFRKENGYKPLPLKTTFDACQFLVSRNNYVARLFYDLHAAHSNMNHSCPYGHDVIVDKLPISHLDDRVTSFLPISTGGYMLRSTWLVYNVPRAIVKVYIHYR